VLFAVVAPRFDAQPNSTLMKSIFPITCNSLPRRQFSARALRQGNVMFVMYLMSLHVSCAANFAAAVPLKANLPCSPRLSLCRSVQVHLGRSWRANIPALPPCCWSHGHSISQHHVWLFQLSPLVLRPVGDQRCPPGVGAFSLQHKPAHAPTALAMRRAHRKGAAESTQGPRPW
jgi:hypothetical protein